jgi:broad specificity phosphatase PhoE
MLLRASRVGSLEDLNRIYNQEDEAGLSDRGRREAAEVAAVLAAASPDALYSSPMLRARETGAVCAERLGMPLAIDEGIRELRTGYLPESSREARLVSALMRLPLLPLERKKALVGGLTIPLYFRAWRQGTSLGGESPTELSARIARFLGRLEREHHDDAHVAVFAHGYLIFTLALQVARGPLERARLWASPYIPNGSVTEIRIDGDRRELVRFADARHIGPRILDA